MHPRETMRKVKDLFSLCVISSDGKGMVELNIDTMVEQGRGRRCLCQGILCFFSFIPSGLPVYGMMLFRIDLPSLDESLWDVLKDTQRWALPSPSTS